MNEFEVVLVFRSPRKCLILVSNLFMFVHFIQTLFILVSGVNCDVHCWILKTNLSSRIEITISARLHLFCFSYHCLLVRYLRCVNEYFAGFVASYLCLAEFRLYLPYVSVKFSQVFSIAYDKTELKKPQRKEDGSKQSKQHCNLILSYHAPLPKSQTATTLPQKRL